MQTLRRIIYPILVTAAAIYVLPWNKIFTPGYIKAYVSCQATDYTCLYKQASIHQNPYVCSLLDPGQEDICYFQLIENETIHAKQCEKIEMKYYQDMCYQK